MSNTNKILFFVTGAVLIAFIFIKNDKPMSKNEVTKAIGTEVNANTKSQPKEIIQRTAASIKPTPELKTIDEINAFNEKEALENKKDLSEEVQVFKELSDLNSDQFIEDIKAIEVFDKELAAELREDLNLKPSDLDDMQPEYTEQLEVDYDQFDIGE